MALRLTYLSLQLSLEPCLYEDDIYEFCDDAAVAEEVEMDPLKNCGQQQQRADCTPVCQKAVVTPPLEVSVYTHYENEHSLVVGVILIVAGALCIIFAGIGVGLYNLFSFVAHGVWFGVVVSKPTLTLFSCMGATLARLC